MNASHAYRLAAPIFASVLFLSACTDEAQPTPAEKAAAAIVPGSPPGAADDLARRNAAASDIKESNALVEFAYSYPRDASAIAALAAWLDTDRATKRDALIAEARRDQAAATRGGFPYHQHSHIETWQRITDTPRFLSLSSEIATYTGGAHGMTNFDTLLWDRTRAIRRKPLDLFTSGEAFDAAVRNDFCAAVQRAKSAKGIQRREDPGGPFSECPSASAQTVWLGSSDGRHFDRLTIAIAPYEIGPYAEGSYKINVGVTAALVRAVKPEFSRDFLPVS